MIVCVSFKSLLIFSRPDYTKRTPGEGMPFPENPKQKGDLILKFNIEFPIYLPLSNKNQIKKAFEEFRTSIERDEYILILINKMRRNIDDNIPFRRGDRLEFICETWFRKYLSQDILRAIRHTYLMS